MGEVGETGEEEKPVRTSFCGERDMSSAGRFKQTASAVEELIVSGGLVGGLLDIWTWDFRTEVIVRHKLTFGRCKRQEERLRGGGHVNSVDDMKNACSTEMKERHLIEGLRAFYNRWNRPRPDDK